MPSVLYTLLRGSKILIFLLIFINIFSNILIYVQPLYIGSLVGFFSSNGTIDIQYCIILFLLFVSNSLLNALTNYCSQLLSQRFVLKLQLLVGRHIFNLSTSELARYSNGELASRTISDITVAKNIVSPQVLSLPGTILLILCSTITIIIIDPLLSLTTIFLLALILIISLISGKQIAKLTKSIQQQYSHIGENIQKFASSAIFVKANNLETQSIRNYTLASESLFHSSKKLARILAILSPISSLAAQFFLIIVIFLGSMRIASNDLSYQSLAVIITFLLVLVSPLGSFTSSISSIASAVAAFERLKPLIGDNQATHTFTGNLELANSCHRLRFDNVSVQYSPYSPAVFQAMSFELPENGLVSVTGPSGSGKTTLALTAIGIITPSEGQILYGTQTIEQLGGKFIREHLVSLVLQESPLYGRTLRESLTLGRNITDSTVLRWFEPFGLTSFYRKLPDGLDSALSDLISDASAGEMQRLSIIRGFLRNTPIIILDEPTSHLDAESERKVSNAIQMFAKDHTVVVISHRLEPIQNAVFNIQL